MQIDDISTVVKNFCLNIFLLSSTSKMRDFFLISPTYSTPHTLCFISLSQFPLLPFSLLIIFACRSPRHTTMPITSRRHMLDIYRRISPFSQSYCKIPQPEFSLIIISKNAKFVSRQHLRFHYLRRHLASHYRFTVWFCLDFLFSPIFMSCTTTVMPPH